MKLDEFQSIQTYAEAFEKLAINRKNNNSCPFADEINEGMVYSSTLSESNLKPSKLSSQKLFGLQSDSSLLGRIFAREIWKAYRFLEKPHPIASDDKAMAEKSGERIIRQLVARCFNDSPLVELDPKIRGLFKQLLRLAFRNRITRQVDKLSEWFSEGTCRFVSRDIDSLNEIFRSPDLFLSAGLIGRSNKNEFRGLSNDCHARAKNYADQGIDLAEAIKDIKKRKEKEKVYVLDLGCSGARTLYDLKCEFGDRIVTVGISLYEEPHLYTDLFLNRPFEVLPDSFRNRFDLVFSRYGFDYSFMPHIAIDNAFNCLAPGGVFHLYRQCVSPLVRIESERTAAILTEIYCLEIQRLQSDCTDQEWEDYLKRAGKYLENSMKEPTVLASSEHMEELKYCADGLMNYNRFKWEKEIATEIGDGPNVFLGHPITTEINHWVTFTKHNRQ